MPTSTNIMWAWLCVVCWLVTTAWSDPCPSHCRCYRDADNYRAAHCSPAALSPQHHQLFLSLDLLHFKTPHKSNPIKLMPNMFERFRNLKVLNLANSSIHLLPHDVFRGLTSVVEIDLSFNRIRYLKGSIFKDLPHLQTLLLRGNSPLSISRQDGLVSDSLIELDLGQCGITVLDKEAFSGLQKLTHLSLDGNHLTTLAPRSLPYNLHYINLANNAIVEAPIYVLRALSYLRMLDLSGNPIRCTCPLMFMHDWLSGRGISFENDVYCDSPPPFKGLRLDRVDEDELCRYETQERSRKERHIHKKYRDISSSPMDVMINDQPLESDAEVLYSNDETRRMGTHMETIRHVKEDNEEGSGSPEEEERSSKEEVNIFDLDESSETTTKPNDGTTSFEFIQDENDNDLPLGSADSSYLPSTTEETTVAFHSSSSTTSSDIFEGSGEEITDPTLPSMSSTEGTTTEGYAIFSSSSEPSSSTSKSDDVFDAIYSSSSSTTTEVTMSFSSTEPLTSSTFEPPTSENPTSSSTEFPSSSSTTEESPVFIFPPISSPEEDGSKELTSSTEIPVTETMGRAVISDIESENDFNNAAPSISDDTYWNITIYIIVCIIVIPLIALILLALYRKRSPRKVRLPRDAESNHGTELQDMDTLLPGENGVKVVTKANGAASPQDSKDPEEIQPVLNGPMEEDNEVIQPTLPAQQQSQLPPSPAEQVRTNGDMSIPIQKTKAKLTVLQDSIPKTPVFIHKSILD